jgi:cytidine deaminase
MDVRSRQQLVAAAIDHAASQGADDERGAAALLLEDGRVLTSTSPPFLNAAVNVCHEMGAILQAWNEQRRVVASVCVVEKDGDMIVLTPCGVCQEQLRLWGPDVQVAVGDGGTDWQFVMLGSLQPHWWGAIFED